MQDVYTARGSSESSVMASCSSDINVPCEHGIVPQLPAARVIIVPRQDDLYHASILCPAIDLQSTVGILLFAVFHCSGFDDHNQWLQRNLMVLTCFGKGTMALVRVVSVFARDCLPDAFLCCRCHRNHRLHHYYDSQIRYQCSCQQVVPYHARCEPCFRIRAQVEVEVAEHSRWLRHRAWENSD